MDAISDGAGSKPHTHNGNLAALPAVLAPLCDTANWLIFRWVQNGSEQWTKPPFQSLCPARMARNNACETWSSHAAAVAAVKAGQADGPAPISPPSISTAVVIPSPARLMTGRRP